MAKKKISHAARALLDKESMDEFHTFRAGRENRLNMLSQIQILYRALSLKVYLKYST